MDAEEEDRKVVNTHSAWRAPQVDVSPSVTSTKVPCSLEDGLHLIAFPICNYMVNL